MNTKPKGLTYLSCKNCGEIYAKVGEVPVLLIEQKRRGLAALVSGEGVCPKHRRTSDS